MKSASAPAYALLSVVAALLTILIKLASWYVTGSVGLLSDAAESVANLAAALVAVWALTLAAQPPDEEHAYGHSKAEYLASGIEGMLILGAAAGIVLAAVRRLVHPEPLQRIWLGLVISLAAALINGFVALVLLRAAKRFRSITLRADAHHLLTDVWTSAGVLVGVSMVKVTGLQILDPLVALAVAANIVWTAARILKDTGKGVMDTALSSQERQLIRSVLSRFNTGGVAFHALRTRAAGSWRFLSVHVLVPGSWTVQRGHDLCEQVENDLREALPRSTVFTHMEPVEDPVSWDDQVLDRARLGKKEDG
jgi:cation diffusion facilitator family transporter